MSNQPLPMSVAACFDYARNIGVDRMSVFDRDVLTSWLGSLIGKDLVRLPATEDTIHIATAMCNQIIQAKLPNVEVVVTLAMGAERRPSLMLDLRDKVAHPNCFYIEQRFPDADLAGWSGPGYYFRDGEENLYGPFASEEATHWAEVAKDATERLWMLADHTLNLVDGCLTADEKIDELKKRLSASKVENRNLLFRLEDTCEQALELFGEVLEIDRGMDVILEHHEAEKAEFEAGCVARRAAREREGAQPVLSFTPWSKEGEFFSNTVVSDPEYDRLLSLVVVPPKSDYNDYAALVKGDIIVGRHHGKIQVRRMLTGGLRSEIVAGPSGLDDQDMSYDASWPYALVRVRHADGSWVHGFGPEKPRYRLARSSSYISFDDERIAWPVHFSRDCRGEDITSLAAGPRPRAQVLKGLWNAGCYDVLLKKD